MKFSKKEWQILLVFTMLIWGTLAPVTRSLKDMPQGLLTFLRVFFAALVVIFYLMYNKIDLKIEKKDIFNVLFSSIISGYIPPLLYNLGVKNTSAILGSILINSNPLFVPFFSLILLHKKDEIKKLFYVLIGCIGVIVISLSNKIEFSLSSDFFIGILLLLFGAMMIGLNTVLGYKLVKKYSGIKIGAYYMIVGSVCLFIQTLLSGELQLITSLTKEQLFLSAYIGIFPTAIVWVIFLSSMKVLSSTESATFKLLIPVFSTIFAVIFLAEFLTLNLVLGGLIIFLSIYMVQKNEKTAVDFE